MKLSNRLKWPAYKSFKWPAHISFKWPAYRSFKWPAYRTFKWPAYRSLKWPARPDKLTYRTRVTVTHASDPSQRDAQNTCKLSAIHWGMARDTRWKKGIVCRVPADNRRMHTVTMWQSEVTWHVTSAERKEIQNQECWMQRVQWSSGKCRVDENKPIWIGPANWQLRTHITLCLLCKMNSFNFILKIFCSFSS